LLSCSAKRVRNRMRVRFFVCAVVCPVETGTTKNRVFQCQDSRGIYAINNVLYLRHCARFTMVPSRTVSQFAIIMVARVGKAVRHEVLFSAYYKCILYCTRSSEATIDKPQLD
jgi:hypothetical protein